MITLITELTYCYFLSKKTFCGSNGLKVHPTKSLTGMWMLPQSSKQEWGNYQLANKFRFRLKWRPTDEINRKFVQLTQQTRPPPEGQSSWRRPTPRGLMFLDWFHSRWNQKCGAHLSYSLHFCRPWMTLCLSASEAFIHCVSPLIANTCPSLVSLAPLMSLFFLTEQRSCC